jgi:hypothetical protein
MDSVVPQDAYQDGNVLAGPLAEIFAMDMTGTVGTCAGCRESHQLAQLHVYGHAPGLVARCPACGMVNMRLVRSPTDAWFDLGGTLNLRIPLPGQ